ncbi:hypothetical protein [Pseudomonas syringae]|uniref:hypothetical protein n=1 Tax=Pseudomonas syringae TaxID=317 RepID=UPI001F13D9F5|nr:hypothetical protein [Pseudomonas syringae]
MTVDIEKLEALAEAAEKVKPGRWFVHRDGLGSNFEPHPHQNYGVDDGQGCVVVWHGVERRGGIPHEEVAEFIAAANPASVLELTRRIANLELCQTASLGVSGIIKSAASELGFDAAGEDSALDCLIGLARKAGALRAECEALRKDASLHSNLQRAAGELPGAWSIGLFVERHACWVSLLDGDGRELELSGEGHLGEQVSEALEVALEMSKEAAQ